jgi:hypothetical protein
VEIIRNKIIRVNVISLSSLFNNIATWHMKARIVEPEETSIPTQRLGKQVSATTDTQATIKELLGTIFSIRTVQSGYKEEFSRGSSIIEA